MQTEKSHAHPPDINSDARQSAPATCLGDNFTGQVSICATQGVHRLGRGQTTFTRASRRRLTVAATAPLSQIVAPSCTTTGLFVP